MCGLSALAHLLPGKLLLNIGAQFDAFMAGILKVGTVPFKILLIIVLAVLANWILRVLLRRAVNRIVYEVKSSQDVESTSDIKAAPYLHARSVQRTRTLGSVGRAVITWTIVAAAIILILDQLGVNLAAVLASAGIAAAGLAFGAQNLVKDVLNGIFMVFEDQLGVGDIVTIGEVTGTVENVGIRVTQLRAVDGTLWFVRNGEVLCLGNASQGWGRALIDITVDARQDLNRVSEVALEAATKLMHSEKLARKVTGEPEVLGLESVFGDRATLRVAIRTRPDAKWEVQRGLRAELRNSFAQHGITLATEFPNFPKEQ